MDRWTVRKQYTPSSTNTVCREYEKIFILGHVYASIIYKTKRMEGNEEYNGYSGTSAC